jgi:hypothetical protein
MISPLNTNLAVQGENGQPAPDQSITHVFHRWLQELARATLSPFRLDAYTGSQTVTSTQNAILVKRLELRGTDRLTVEGSARVVICG